MATLTVGRSIRFSASHSLPHVPVAHKCSRLHGHSYRVDVEVTGVPDELLGWVVDFGHLDVALQLLYVALDHRHLNDIEGLANPTSEVLSAWCAARVRIALRPGLELASVTIHEGDGGGWCRWTP